MKAIDVHIPGKGALTVVNVARPALQADLHATLADVQWVVESYARFVAALLLIAGSPF